MEIVYKSRLAKQSFSVCSAMSRLLISVTLLLLARAAAADEGGGGTSDPAPDTNGGPPSDPAPPSDSAPTPPNIVMVVLDDVGWADFNYSIGGELSVSVNDHSFLEH